MINTTELVSINYGTITTTSLQIAEVFEKKHSHIIRDIERLLKELPEDFNGSNFGLVEYKDAKGELRPMYKLTRDAFTLLAMGFTGKKALAFKLKYIEAFNAMEQQLQQKAKLAFENEKKQYKLNNNMLTEYPILMNIFSTSEERKNIRALVSVLSDITQELPEYIYRDIHEKFNILSITELMKKHITKVEYYLCDCIELQLSRRGKTIKEYFNL